MNGRRPHRRRSAADEHWSGRRSARVPKIGLHCATSMGAGLASLTDVAVMGNESTRRAASIPVLQRAAERAMYYVSRGAGLEQFDDDSLLGLGRRGARAAAPGCLASEVGRGRAAVVLQAGIGTRAQEGP